jgi:hypothetical protein
MRWASRAIRDVTRTDQPEETLMKATLFGLAAILGLGLAVSAPNTAEAKSGYGKYGYYGYHGHYHYPYYKKRWVRRHFYPYYHYGYYHRPYRHYW